MLHSEDEESIETHTLNEVFFDNNTNLLNTINK